MIDLMLRFEDEILAIAILPEYRTVFADGSSGWLTASYGHVLDCIGSVVITPAVIDAETDEIIAHAILDERFHLNLRLLANTVPAGLKPYQVNPADPARTWA